MITFADVQERFAVLPIADLGKCIVIPQEEVTPDIIQAIKQSGNVWLQDRLDGHEVVFVQVGPDTECKGRRQKVT
jgi:hypothetical protein